MGRDPETGRDPAAGAAKAALFKPRPPGQALTLYDAPQAAPVRKNGWPGNATVRSSRSEKRGRLDSSSRAPWDHADIMVSGGAEAGITPMGVGGFIACRALSTRNDDPPRASRPFDKDRDGFVLSEGAGVMVFEEFEHAKKRGAKILAEVLGYGASADGGHITQPDEHGTGAERHLRAARPAVTRTRGGGSE